MARAGARPPRLASDGELVERARSGCDDAFAELTRRHRATLVSACSRVVGADLAEDAAQQALLKALVALRGAGQPPAEIRAWLLRVARNESIDMVRRRAVEQGLTEEIAPVGEARSPHEVVEGRRELRSVVREIGRLPERQRQALLLRAIEGHGYDEIAEALEASDGVVRQLIYRARERVRAAAAAVIAPLWLLRRGVPAAHAVKVGAAVTTATLAVGGAAILHHGPAVVAGGSDVAHAATPATHGKPEATRVVLGGEGGRRRHVRVPQLRAPRAHRPAARRTKSVAPRRSAKSTTPKPPAGHRSQSPVHRHTPATPGPPAPGEGAPSQDPPPAAPSPHPDASPPPSVPTTPTPPPDPTPPAGPAAPPAVGTISSYQQSAGFGGPLTIERASGESVTAYFGELVQLTCYFVRDGQVVSHDTCTKDRLIAGTHVARAEHAPNDRGYDVWTRVDLIVPAP